MCPSTSSHRCANMGSNPVRPYLQNAAFIHHLMGCFKSLWTEIKEICREKDTKEYFNPTSLKIVQTKLIRKSPKNKTKRNADRTLDSITVHDDTQNVFPSLIGDLKAMI